MTSWLKANAAWLILTGVAFLGGYFLGQPRQVDSSVRVVPHIVIQAETLKYIPKNILDSLKIWRSRKTTSDTFQLIQRITIAPSPIDTQTIWPIVVLNSSSPSQLSVITQHGPTIAQTTLFAPGPVTGVYADSNATPRIQFGTWPQYHQSTLSKVLEVSAGFAACKISEWRP